MKIIFYINTISHGGAERVITNLASEMTKRGFDCTIVTTFRCSWEYEIDKMVNRISLYEERPQNFFKRNIQTILKLRKILYEQKPDLIITFMAEPNFRGIIAKLGTGVKSIISVRNDPKKEYGNKLKIIAKVLFRYSDYSIFQTTDAQNWFPSYIKHQSEIIFNPINEKFYKTELSKKRKGIVTMGRIAQQKNHKLLIKAYSLISDKVLDDLYIYGSGDSKHLKEYSILLGINERVHFMGQCSDVPTVLSNSRLFVLSSDYEGMPNALMEAMAVGLPCISTDCPCGGPKMLFNKNIHDYLVPVGDAKYLSECIYNILSNKDKEDFLALECKKSAIQFESYRIFDKWEKMIRKVINNE